MKNFPKMHVSLYVSDITKTVSFYESFFGQSADKVKSDYAKFILDAPALIISFVQNAEKVASDFGHLGFQVETPEQLEEKRTLSKKEGLIYLEETGTNCCYALQDKFWARDPDGYMWEVYYFHEDVAFNDPRYESESAEACCTPTKPKVALADIPVLNSCGPKSGCC